MLVASQAEIKGQVGGVAAEFSPTKLNISSVDLKVQAARSSAIIELAGFTRFLAVVEYVIAGTTPTVGKVDLDIELYALDGSTLIMSAVELLTLSSTEAAGTRRTSVAWGVGTTAVRGTATSTLANMDALKVIPKARLILDVAIAYDQTGAKTASVYFYGSA